MLKEVEKRFNIDTNAEKIALQDINLEIQKGDLLAIIGKSGSGKSTLLNIIGTMDVPTSGKYYLDNIDIINSRKNLHTIRNKKIGFILQDFALINSKTAIENIEIPLLFNKNIPMKEVKNKSIEIMNNLGIEHLANQIVKTLSGGEKQRVAISRALVNEPDIILADEPTGALDSKTSKDIMANILQINKAGKTVIIVTHDLEIASMCNSIIELKDGRIDSVY